MGFGPKNIISFLFSLFTVLLFAVSGLFMSCAPALQQDTPSVSAYRTISVQDDSRHLMLGFAVVERDNADSAFLHFLQFNPGIIVEESDTYELQPGDLQIEVGDTNGQILRTFNVQDPNHRIIESFSESGELETSVIEEKSAEFFIRLNYSAGMQLLRLYKLQEGGSRKLLLAQSIVEE